MIRKIRKAIWKIKSERTIVSARSCAELKEDYTFEDEMYIMSMRNELIELYLSHLEIENSNIVHSTAYSDSTMVEEENSTEFSTAEKIG